MKKLPEAELEIMMAVWHVGKPVCRFELEEALSDNQWASTTILTMLSRLEKKGWLVSQKKGKVKYYEAKVSEEEYAAGESKGMLERFFGNSLKKFVACMASQEKFTEEELEELRTFLDEQKEKHTQEEQESGN